MERLIYSSLSRHPVRRGVLLLLVLSLLTLFMMLGATYLVIATRSRATARAFASATSGAQSTPSSAIGQAFVDEAFLRVVRGSAGGSSGVVSNADTLLGDKYGLPSSGTATFNAVLNGSASGAIVITTTATVSGTEAVEDLSGRVLTFTVPGLTNASTRILRAEPVNGNATLYLPGGPTLSGGNLTAAAIASATAATGISHFVINGREFCSGTAGPNEPWDGYDSNNDFLANPLTPATRPSFLTSGGLGTNGTNLFVDNDGDGVLDSGWLDIGLPPIVNAAGQTLYPRAAILITDLDGRLNINAHGSRSELDNPSSLYSDSFVTGPTGLANVTSATSSFATLSLSQYPRGRGLGPAEIALESSGLFESTSGPSGRLALTGVDSIALGTDDTLQRTPPKVGAAEGRYGGAQLTTSSTTFPRPGTPYKDDSVTSLTQSWMIAPGISYFTNPVRYGSPPDLKAVTRIFVDDFGQPVYYRPYWGPSGSRPTNVDDESIDDPYEANLSRLGPRSGAIVNPATRTTQSVGNYSSDYRTNAPYYVPDSLYTASDLEGLLRAYDIDSPKLSRRLPAICGTNTGDNRLLLTTDSWDTSAMTGPARAAVSKLIATSSTASGMSVASAMSMFAPETLMGHKLDLNRPFHDTKTTEPPDDGASKAERLAFAKHFYCLAFAVAGNGGRLNSDKTKAAAIAREIAQWAINVVDFRDTDAVMTGFEYDTDITNGWNVNGDLSDDGEPDRDVVWGAERPELLITETVCWHDRRTDDLAFTNGATQNYQVLDWDPAKQDDDFDQQRRPQGCFLFELYSPWGSQLAEIDSSVNKLSAVRRGIVAGGTSALRADPIPIDVSTGSAAAATAGMALDRFDPEAAVNLSGTTKNGYPVWRVLTLKTGTGLPAVSDPAISISGSVWRSFYFTAPPVELVRTGTTLDPASGTNAIAFWPSTSATSTLSLKPQVPTVFGSGTATGGPAGTVTMDTLFKATVGVSSSTTGMRLATLTEPLITSGSDASLDAYQVLTAQSTSGTVTFPLSPPNDTPLDTKTFSLAGLTTLTGTDGNNTLMQNGRHANYFLMHLQRVANPLENWDKLKNPYVTVDTQPIDLVVFNTSSGATFPQVTPNYDEPLSGLPQRKYDVAQRANLLSSPQTLNVQRGNTQSSGTTDHDIWSARVNPEGATDDWKLLSISSETRSAEAMDPPPEPATRTPGNLVPVSAPPMNQHTLGTLFSIFGTGSSAPTRPFPWMMWANRPFTSAAELSLVPKTSSFQLLRLHNTAAATGSDALKSGVFGHLPRLFEPIIVGSATTTLPTPWDAIAGRNSTSGAVSDTASSIWDVVHVPTPFGGSYQDVPLTSSGSAALSPIGLDKRPYGQFPHFREPGRINVNTVTGTAVWTALLGSGTSGTAIQSWTPGAAPFDTPAKTLLEALGRYHPTVSGTTSFIDTYTEASRDAATNAYFRYQTVNRLANLTTIRSNVFAIWVTIGYSTSPSGWSEAGGDTGEIRRHRGFYIFDRSIPVGFDPGKDLNVRDAILLRRIIQ
jgi:hypothetical protein